VSAINPTCFKDFEGDIAEAALMAAIAMRLLEHVSRKAEGCLVTLTLTDQEEERLHFALNNTFARIETVKKDFLKLMEGGAE